MVRLFLTVCLLFLCKISICAMPPEVDEEQVVPYQFYPLSPVFRVAQGQGRVKFLIEEEDGTVLIEDLPILEVLPVGYKIAPFKMKAMKDRSPYASEIDLSGFYSERYTLHYNNDGFTYVSQEIANFSMPLPIHSQFWDREKRIMGIQFSHDGQEQKATIQLPDEEKQQEDHQRGMSFFESIQSYDEEDNQQDPMMEATWSRRFYENGKVYTIHEKMVPQDENDLHNRLVEDWIEAVFTHPGNQVFWVEPIHFWGQKKVEDPRQYNGEYVFWRDSFEEAHQDLVCPSKEIIYVKKGKIYIPKVTHEVWKRESWRVGFRIFSYNEKYTARFNDLDASLLGYMEWPDGLYRKISRYEIPNEDIYGESSKYGEYWERLYHFEEDIPKIYQVFIKGDKPSILADLILKGKLEDSIPLLSTFSGSSLVTSLIMKPSFYKNMMDSSLKNIFYNGLENWKHLRRMAVLIHDSRQSMRVLNQLQCASETKRAQPPQLEKNTLVKLGCALRQPILFPRQNASKEEITTFEKAMRERQNYERDVRIFFDIQHDILRHLSTLPYPDLEELDIETVDGPLQIGNLFKLKTLRIADPLARSNDSWINISFDIRNLTNLQELSLGAFSFDQPRDDFSAALRQLKSLKTLSLSLAWRKPEQEEHHVRDFLRGLEVENLNIDFAAFREQATFDVISRLSSLKALSLKRGDLTGELIKPLIDLDQLTSLSFSGNPRLGDAGLFPFLFRMAFWDPNVSEKIKLYEREGILQSREQADTSYRSGQPYALAKYKEERYTAGAYTYTERKTTLEKYKVDPYRPWTRIQSLNLDDTGLKDQETWEMLSKLTRLTKLSVSHNALEKRGPIGRHEGLVSLRLDENNDQFYPTAHLEILKVSLPVIARRVMDDFYRHAPSTYEGVKILYDKKLIQESEFMDYMKTQKPPALKASVILTLLKANHLLSRRGFASLLGGLPSHISLHIFCEKSSIEDGQLDALQDLEQEGIKITVKESNVEDFYKLNTEE